MNFKGVLIDFGYTLAYIDKEEDLKYRRELVSVLNQFGHDKSLKEFSPFLDGAYRSNRAGETSNMKEFWSSLLKLMNISADTSMIQEFEKCRKRQLGRSIKLYDNAYSVLDYLKKKYRLALVTNCATGLSDVLEVLGLKQYFDHMILSYEVKSTKPDKQMLY